MAVLRFALRCAVILALLLLTAPVWEAAYGSWLRTLGNALFHQPGSAIVVRFIALHERTAGEHDTLVKVKRFDRRLPDGRIPVTDLKLRSRLVGGMPTVLFFAMTLASAAWRRARVTRVCAALVLVQAFVAFSLWILVLAARFDLADPLSARPDAWWEWALASGYGMLIHHRVPGLVLVVWLWAWVAAVEGRVTRGRGERGAWRAAQGADSRELVPPMPQPRTIGGPSYTRPGRAQRKAQGARRGGAWRNIEHPTSNP